MSPQPFEPARLTLLARGAVRLDGAIPPMISDHPATIGANDASAAALVKKKLAAWIGVVDETLAWKRKAGSPIGLIITDLGRAALEAVETEIVEAGPSLSKIGHLIERLRLPDGISISEIITATGWQAHSARAALTALRKRGFVITKVTGAQGTRYRAEQGERQ